MAASFCLIIYDKLLTLKAFSFVYTDIDQVLMWNGAVDYAKGIFHEPFFYGQTYNYMLEPFLAIPLLWLNTPVYKALPLVTSVLSLLPFGFLAIFLVKKKQLFWAQLCLVFQLFLPAEYNLLTTMPRGFIQAHLFFPLLFIPILWTKNKNAITLLYLGAALCVVANQSALLLVVPIFFYVWLTYYKTPSFYLKALWLLPVFTFDFSAKYFYDLYPERIVHGLKGLSLNIGTFLDQLNNPKLFEHLFPFASSWGVLYPLVFVALAVWAKFKQRKHAFWFLILVLILLIISLFIPKIHEIYFEGGLFFTSSRLYLTLPLLFFLGLYLTFKGLKTPSYASYLVFVTAVIFLTYKAVNLNSNVVKVVGNTDFPVIKTKTLISQINALEKLTTKHKVDVVINSSKNGWKHHFDNYAFYPLTESKKTISLSQTNDRRYWLYQNALDGQCILLNGIPLDSAQKKRYDVLIINKDLTLINADRAIINELLEPRSK